MNIPSGLIGRKIKIIIDDDGTDNPPDLPSGEVVRSLLGTDPGTYFMVKLDNPVRCIRASTHQDSILSNLVIKNRYKGESLDSMITQPPGKFVTIGISNVLSPIPRDELVLDFTKVEYFAIGRALNAIA